MRKQIHRGGTFALLAMVGVLAGCGGSGGGGSAMMDDPVPSPVNAVMLNDWPDRTTSLTEAARVADIERDGAGGFNVTYEVKGESKEVALATDLYDEAVGAFVSAGNTEYRLWDKSDTFTDDPRYDHLNINGWVVCVHPSAENACFPPSETLADLEVYRGFVVWGEVTETPPMGSASYDGRFEFDGFMKGDPRSTTSRSRYRGDTMLTADFDSSTLMGSFDGDQYRPPGAQAWQDTVFGLVLEAGEITGSDLEANLTGSGMLSGFTGQLAGHFYGPAADEVGGTLTGEDAAQVFSGFFGGDKQ